jgi:hypothetical protein
MPRVNSKVYIVHTLDNDTDTLEEEYDDYIADCGYEIEESEEEDDD